MNCCWFDPVCALQADEESALQFVPPPDVPSAVQQVEALSQIEQLAAPAPPAPLVPPVAPPLVPPVLLPLVPPVAPPDVPPFPPPISQAGTAAMQVLNEVQSDLLRQPLKACCMALAFVHFSIVLWAQRALQAMVAVAVLASAWHICCLMQISLQDGDELDDDQACRVASTPAA